MDTIIVTVMLNKNIQARLQCSCSRISRRLLWM